MAAPHMPLLTAEEYLARERAAEFKSEFYAGHIVAMAGARKAHIRIVANLMRHLGNALAGTPCGPFSNDIRVAPDPTQTYFYPDVVVAYDDQRYLDEKMDTLLNPRVVIEVASPSTRTVDRTAKLTAYLAMKSVTDYVMIDSAAVEVEHYRRDGDRWVYTLRHELNDVLDLAAVDLRVPLEQIYERVFPVRD